MTGIRALILDGSIFPDIYRPAEEWRALLEGVPADAVRVSAGEPLPDLAPYTHLIVTGSEASITRPEPWYEVAAGAVHAFADAGKAVLGSCFGHQLLARTLSGPACVRASATPEIGWIAVDVEGRGDDELFCGLPRRFHVFAAHFDEVCGLPAPWITLASSAGCEVQAMRYGSAPIWGLQAHPEITPERAGILLRGFQDLAPDKAHLVAPALEQTPRDDGLAPAIVRRFLGAAGSWAGLVLAAVLTVACAGAPPVAVADPEPEAPVAEPSPMDWRPVSFVPDRPLPGCSVDEPLPVEPPEDADAKDLHALGQERILARDGAGAVALLLLAAARSPKDPWILGDLATALLQCRLFSEAVPRAEAAATLAPGSVDLRANLAQTYQIVERFRDAVATYRAAVELAPDDASLRNNLAVVLLARGEPAEAEEQARAAAALAPENATFRVNLSYVLLRRGDPAGAEAEARRAVELEPASAAARNQLGLALAARGSAVEAAAAFSEALRLDPDHRAAKENLRALEAERAPSGP